MMLIHNDELTTKEYVKAFNSSSFRIMLQESIADKQKRFDRLKAFLDKAKVELRVAVEKEIEIEFNGHPKYENILDGSWWFVWKWASMDDIKKLKAWGSQIRNLEVALRLARAEITPVPVGKAKRGYSDDDLEEARSMPIVAMLDGKIRHTGSKHIANCPFHKEKTGSFFVYDDNSWHCFGCQAHGNDAIDFIERQNNVGFLDAVRFLLGR